MKQYIFLFALTAFVATAFVGCKNEDPSEHHFDNKLYISAAAFTDEMLIKNAVSGYSRDIVVGMPSPASSDICVEIGAAPDLLDRYRMAYYDTAAELLGKEFYQIENPQTRIPAGSVTSIPVTVKFLDTNLLDREKRYVLPVTILASDGMEILESARTLYFLFKGSSLINVVADLNDQAYASPSWSGNADVANGLKQFTLEALINANKLDKMISTVMGIEDHFLIRLGDAGVPANQIQIATKRGNRTNSDLQIETNRWYHLAVTFDDGDIKVYLDGVEKLSGSVSMSSVDLGVKHNVGDENEDGVGERFFWVGYSYDTKRCFDGKMSEVRIWNRALSAEEINAPDHFYSVESDSEGLISYWKFDEDDRASGTIADRTANGNDMYVVNTIKWFDVTLPETGK
ncbi:DUF1735 and LamG domain-containing protein [Alistipes senegalensis]|uniref:DUF1735 and LamG domain-containing protein n=1 Tax=Alistipes senegalensis TaxID=1288121 RepID=UPI0018AA9886|nr:DUF1735 and LamG domain-containing protein [Alistipes senegalensis]